MAINLQAKLSVIDHFTRPMRRMQKQMDSMRINATSLSKSVGGVSAAIGALGPASAGVGALASSFAAASAGAVGFGVVATSALNDVFDAADEVDKLNEKIKMASSATEAAKAQAELAKVYGGLSKAQGGALKDLQNFKSNWKDYVKEFEKPVFSAFGKSLTLVENLMAGLKPTIAVTGDVINKVLDKINNSFKSDDARKFFDYLSTTAGPSLTAMLTTAGNVTKGFMSILVAFAPLTDSVNGGLVSMTQKFADWSASLSNSKGFQAFIDYAKTNGPILISTFQNVVDVGKNIVVALAPLGTTLLAALKSFTGGLTSLTTNTGLVKVAVVGIVGTFLAFKAALTALTFIQTLATMFTTFKTVITVARTAMLALNVAMLANPIGLVIAAVVALIAIGVLLYKNWDKVKAVAGTLWTKTKEVFGNIYDWGKSKIQPVVDFFVSLGDKFNDFKSAISNFKLPSWVSKIGGKLASFVAGNNVEGSFAVGTNSVPRDMIAQIHRGEMIIPRKQSELLRKSGVNIGNVTSLSQQTYDPKLSRRGSYSYDEGQALATSKYDGHKDRSSVGSITIAKLADSIVVREESDIEKIAERLAREIWSRRGVYAL